MGIAPLAMSLETLCLSVTHAGHREPGPGPRCGYMTMQRCAAMPDSGMRASLLWHDRGVDPSSNEEIASLLRGLLIRLDDRLTGTDVMLIAEFIDVGELALALEQMADVLSEDEQSLAPDERADMLALVQRMHMDQRVPHALTLCPAR